MTGHTFKEQKCYFSLKKRSQNFFFFSKNSNNFFFLNFFFEKLNSSCTIRAQTQPYAKNRSKIGQSVLELCREQNIRKKVRSLVTLLLSCLGGLTDFQKNCCSVSGLTRPNFLSSKSMPGHYRK